MKALRDGRLLAGTLLELLADFSPERVAARALGGALSSGQRPSRVFSLGKAAPGLARAASSLWPEVPGLLYGTSPDGSQPASFDALYGDHPFPTAHNLEATARVERWVASGEGPLLALISGGGSSLLVHPRVPWSLEEKAALVGELWLKGAPIREVNTVRARLSEVKGGGLGLLAGRWSVFTAIWSDVGPDDAALVSSAPTLPLEVGQGAESILARYGVGLPRKLPAPRKPLESGALGSSSDQRYEVLFDATALRRACARRLEGLGCVAAEVPCPEGAAVRQVAASLVASLRALDGRGPRAAIGVGEPSVDAFGKGGRGGRCSHLAAQVAFAMGELPASCGWAFAAIATDGVDGSAGGGAWVDSEMKLHQNQIAAAIEACDTGRLWEEGGTLLARKPTGNNLRDLWALVELA